MQIIFHNFPFVPALSPISIRRSSLPAAAPHNYAGIDILDTPFNLSREQVLIENVNKFKENSAWMHELCFCATAPLLETFR
jgi:hypothetical protein